MGARQQVRILSHYHYITLINSWNITEYDVKQQPTNRLSPCNRGYIETLLRFFVSMFVHLSDIQCMFDNTVETKLSSTSLTYDTKMHFKAPCSAQKLNKWLFLGPILILKINRLSDTIKCFLSECFSHIDPLTDKPKNISKATCLGNVEEYIESVF